MAHWFKLRVGEEQSAPIGRTIAVLKKCMAVSVRRALRTHDPVRDLRRVHAVVRHQDTRNVVAAPVAAAWSRFVPTAAKTGGGGQWELGLKFRVRSHADHPGPDGPPLVPSRIWEAGPGQGGCPDPVFRARSKWFRVWVSLWQKRQKTNFLWHFSGNFPNFRLRRRSNRGGLPPPHTPRD
eukprot:COSAG04_NODE_3218_length_3034_cov_725.639182_3_plen_180_part_00